MTSELDKINGKKSQSIFFIRENNEKTGFGVGRRLGVAQLNNFGYKKISKYCLES